MKKIFLFSSMIILGFVLFACKVDKEPDVPEQYLVTFDVDGGSTIESVQVQEGDKVLRPANDPTKSNHTFDNWYSNIEKTNIFKFDDVIILKDTTIYAKWIINEGPVINYVVTFDSNGGSSVANKTTAAGTIITIPEEPTKDGHTFLGWYLDDVEYDFSTTINESFTLIAKWIINEDPVINYVVTFDSNGGSSVANKTAAAGTIITIPEEPTKDGHTFLGWYLDDAEFDFSTTVNESFTLIAKWEEVLLLGSINSEEELLALFANGGDGDYFLTRDLDFSNMDVSSSSASFSGVLDGRGFTINNLNAKAKGNKEGVFFKYVVGGTIKNFVIKNSSITYGGNGEGTGFITFAAHADATFDNLEFINVSVNSVHSYSGLIFAENANDPNPEITKTIKRVTVINNDDNSINGQSYIGGLVGHARLELNLDMSYIYFDSKVIAGINNVPNQVVGSLVGRVQGSGTTINVDNAIIKGTVSGNKNVAAIIGTSVAGTTLNVSNVFVSNFDATVTEGNKIDILVGNVNGMTINSSKVYYDSNSVNLVVINDPILPTQGLKVDIVNDEWFTQSGLSTTYFKLEDGIVKLNRESAPKVPTGITIIQDSINKLYYIGEDIDVSTIEVKLNYSDGSSLTISSDLYDVNIENYNSTISGDYIIVVEYLEWEANITVTVVDVDSYEVFTIDFNDVYLVGNDLNTTGIEVQGKLTNGEIIFLNNSDYTINTNDFDNTKAGVYNLVLSYRDFEVTTISVYVMEEIEVIEDITNVVVDHLTTTDGNIIDNVAYFKTIKSAINYYRKLNLGNDVRKIIELKDGTYVEKLTNNVNNLLIIGESKDNTIINYNSAAGMVKPAGGTWGTQGSAVFTNKGKDFVMANLTIENTFDYFTSTLTDKQAVAIVNEGDRSLFTNLNILSVQDTLYAKSGRQWYINNHIEGAVDYIFGNGGPAYFENNIIHTIYRENSEGVITANKGANSSGLLDYVYVFYNNELTTDNTAKPISLGRPWDKQASVMYIENTIQNGIDLIWTEMSGNKPADARFYEYNNIQDGSILANSTHSNSMTEEEALKAKNKDIVFGIKNGNETFDGIWNYDSVFDFVTSLIS